MNVVRNQPIDRGVIDRLEQACSTVPEVADLANRWPAELRAALETVPTAEDPLLDLAVVRLGLMIEVWECLATDGNESLDELPAFFSDSLRKLVDGLGSTLYGDATRFILTESEARWGGYLALLDPSLETTSQPDEFDAASDLPAGDDAGPAIDTAELLRKLSGLVSASIADMAPSAELSEEPIEGFTLGGSRRVGSELAATNEVLPRNGNGRKRNPSAFDTDGERNPERTIVVEDALLATRNCVQASGIETDQSSVADVEAQARALDPEFREVFLADATDLFTRIQELVLGLGRGDDGSALHELGRCYHTLKGAAGSVGLTIFASQIHTLEDRLEEAEGTASDSLIRHLEISLEQMEVVLQALRGGTGSPEHRANESDGLIRVPADRFEELLDLCSELLTRRRAWTAHAERMKQLADAARTCSYRMRASVEQLGEAAPRDRRSANARAGGAAEDLNGLYRRMSEQAEDLSALAATAREAALPMSDEAESLSRLSLRLWEGLQSVRITPVRGLFQRLVRVARDAARVEGRTIEVNLVGEETGADRLLLDKIYEPLLHVVRNAVGHGIESPEDRSRSGKAPTGRITLEARREGNTLAMSVHDDGRGLDYDEIAAKGRRLGLIAPDERPGLDRLNALIFQPGFSTRSHANAISGRGVGMDVVAREVELLRGRIELSSKAGQGTRLGIRLPARLSLEHVMVARVGGQAFAVPTCAIESVHRDERIATKMTSDRPTITIGNRQLPVLDLRCVLSFNSPAPVSCPTFLVVAADLGTVAIRVDVVEAPLELVVRPLGPLLAGHPAISGAGLTTGGEVVLVFDIAGLLRLASGVDHAVHCSLPVQQRPKVLVVDDSLSVRRAATRNLRSLGFEVDEAADGEQALGKLRHEPYRLILTDLEMPRMDGFALLAELGRTGTLESTFVVVASTLTDPATRRRVEKLGARALLAKPVVAEELADVVGSLLTLSVGSAGAAR
jgi:chemotaxis protein histidine kinase CheA/CheY-like chemotaxis protein